MKRKLAELRVLLTAEPKKAATVGVLLAVLAVVTLRAVVLDGPRKARAGSRADGSGASTTGEPSSSVGTLGAVIRQIPRSPALSRDLFGLDERVFPPPPAEPTDQGQAKSAEELVETQDAPAHAEPDAAALVREQARTFELRSAIVGVEPIAVIEVGKGKQAKRMVLRLGQEVEGFTLRRVTPMSVVLEKQGIEVELQRVMPED